MTLKKLLSFAIVAILGLIALSIILDLLWFLVLAGVAVVAVALIPKVLKWGETR